MGSVSDDGLIRITVSCALCGAVATAAELVPPGCTHPKAGSSALGDVGIYRGFRDRGGLIVESVTGKAARAIAADRFARLAEIFQRQDWLALYQLDDEWVPSYCPTCRAHYCGAHWKQAVEFDDSFYDCTRGCCPKGHWRLLDD